MHSRDILKTGTDLLDFTFRHLLKVLQNGRGIIMHFLEVAIIYIGRNWRPISAILKEKFSTQPNEWYKCSKDLRQNRDILIFLTIHPDSFPLGTGPDPSEIWHNGYYPVVFTKKNYNMLYINMGHNDINYEGNNEELSHTFDNEDQNRIVIDGLKWLASRRAN